MVLYILNWNGKGFFRRPGGETEMKEMVKYFTLGDDYRHVFSALEKGIKEQLVSGLSGSARTLFMAALYYDVGQTQMIVTHNLFQAQKIYEDLIEWVAEEDVILYPVNELISSEIAVASPELKAQRIDVLNKLVENQRPKIIIVPLAGLRRLIAPVHIWKEAQQKLVVGQELDISLFQKKLVSLGYKRVELVESPGEYSVRGGIIDIFSVTEREPFRIELFDTEIDSIRSFDMETQRSLSQREEAQIGPAVELVLNDEHVKMGIHSIKEALQGQLLKMKDSSMKKKLQENVGWELEQLQNQIHFQGIYKYISCFYGMKATIMDYLPRNTLLVLDEPSRVYETEESLMKEEQEWQTSLMHIGEYLPGLNMSVPFDEIRKKKSFQTIYLTLFLRQIAYAQPQNIINFTSKPMQNFHGQFPILQTEIDRWKKSKQVILLFASNEERAKRMLRVLEDFDIEARMHTSGQALLAGIPMVKIGRLHSGFELPLHSLVAVTESEIFTKQQRKKTRPQKNISNAERIKNYSELQVGDYVVHVSHGIGKYLGIETLDIGGIHKDYLHVKYSGNDKLYVPVEQIEQVQKYVGSEEKEPRVYSLGGSEWKKVKSKARSSVQDIAENLIKLYAKRDQAKGFAFSTDSAEHQEFDSLFPYQETDDQLRAIEEIKGDMEKGRPMDRLLCGDVGYGKTEVAIRAAFKAVMDGKQVAILVPTTILAQQHYETFRERFNDYPVEIGVLSRFRTRKEQNQTLKRVKEGTLDILIGTHRLLSKDLQFKDLGLLIVDEEQRFGVSHKEKIKQLKENIDVLTLTATPIPRTLHMSMLGVRDLSVIETPPENRFPVQTYVLEFNGALVREAIERELARGGQIYFLYNQVQGIEQMAEQIRELVPDARVAIAHGQMKESELEAIMIDFLEEQYDVLVSTTIIETGVDIPNVNTLIINDADKMGLSQLYQLRGRVGRSNRMAYAYFTYQRGKALTEVAEKRLQAIKEFTELGSGFKIAMRDLAIRGAGNLLGAEQHGFIASVGFDLYSQMLKEAIDELKDERPKEKKAELEVDVHVDAYIPEQYIRDGKQKIEMYKRIAAIASMEDVREVEEELVDRFGAMPDPIQRLLLISRMKAYALSLKMNSIVLKQEVIKLMFPESLNNQIDGSLLFQIVSKFDRRIGLVSGQQIGVTVKVKGLSETAWLNMVVELMSQLSAANILKGAENHAVS